MKQPQYSPLSVAQMALSLFAVNEGFLDDVPANKVVAFEAALHAHAGANAAELMGKIYTCGYLHDEIASGLKAVVENFKATGAY
jgi:F-type H+-transporting ATPase subunit alpha